MRPLSAKLISPPKELRISQTYDIECQTVGSRPHPNITWTLGSVASLVALPSMVSKIDLISHNTLNTLMLFWPILGQRKTSLVVFL